VQKHDQLLDYSSSDDGSVFQKVSLAIGKFNASLYFFYFCQVHIHVYHGDTIFSKFYFRDGLYDNFTLPQGDFNEIKFYCLTIALESKRLNSSDMYKMFKKVIQGKVIKKKGKNLNKSV
jgi:hypothetical protein